ncbi:MAG: hypothetical protein JKY92_04330, partial [Magnetovibrio sp.]|nr:hypothetical protein [Magnetovibrio sp.]
FKMIGQSLNAPTASSAGRFFDSVAGRSLLNSVQFEGQVAKALQCAAENYPDEEHVYGYEVGATVSWKTMLSGFCMTGPQMLLLVGLARVSTIH